MGRIDVRIKNFEKLRKDLDAINAKSEKVMSNTIKDIKRQAPSWIAQEVEKTFNVKKGRITPKTQTSKKSQAKYGSVSVRGATISNVTFTYKGRKLTVARFGMSPNKVQKMRVGRYPKPYTVSHEVYRGKRETTVGKARYNPVFLAPNLHGMVIAFQRKSDKRTDMESVKDKGVPEMIKEPNVSEGINKRINQGMEKRLQHHLNRALGKER